MESTDLTIEALKGIRHEVRELGTRVDGTNERLEAMSTELRAEVHGMREELSRRIVESEIRTSTAIAELAGTVREMTSVLRASHDLRPRVERCEQEIVEMKRRIG
jgi:predicted  nucleic acid-binding Zn-ribbon protein